jgi:transcription-repair coupling factor (superfamily II helicase)
VILPFVRDLFLSLEKSEAFAALAAAAATPRGHARAGGLTATARVLYAALLARAAPRPALILCPDNKTAEPLHEQLSAFWGIVEPGGPPPLLFPAHDLAPGDHLSPHPDISEKRALALWRMARGQARVIVAPAAAVAMRLEPPARYANLALTVRRGEALAIESLAEHLEAVGYDRREPVEMVGQYSVRGGIVDVFSPEAPRPVRLELFGDEVESIREFDPNSQRSVAPRQETAILPLTDFPMRRELLRSLSEDGLPFPGWEFRLPQATPFAHTVFDLLEDPLVISDEPGACAAGLDKFWERIPEGDVLAARLYLRRDELEQLMAQRRRVELEELAIGEALEVHSQPASKFHGNIPLLVEELKRRVEMGYRAVFFAASTGDAERLADIFQEYEVAFQLGQRQLRPGADGYLEEKAYVAVPVTPAVILKGPLPQGVVLPDQRLAIFGHQDLFDVSELVVTARPHPHAVKSKPAALKAFLSDFRDLQAGDFIVHVEHGIGRYLGVKEIVPAGSDDGAAEFMVLEYAEDARLYVPLTRLDLVQKYRALGETGVQPRLDKLGGISWEKTRKKVKKGMQEMAGELLKLYAERKMAGGYAFSPDSHWQREFEDTFEFQETPDQETAVADVKRDMESPEPMDRLLCGDVGYGKTEVAMRAAMKAVSDGKQVAVLAPTTVLAFQHHETFRQRFAPFPARVEMLSRFRSAREQKQALEDLETGKIDVVIGTHRLLSKDVVFRDLGLLVVDEEQRFGVRHKERIKQMRKQVDVLTMSATPIPRTLHMSLVGLRDMSVIETPPRDRLAIQTVVTRFSEGLVRTALQQELARGGQAYFVHNRVETISEMAAMIQRLVPEARLVVGHGQMDEKQLEKVMLGFVRHEHDILVSTTIIENGLDIPLCNTIIVHRADRMGLSELYQLRGRVGRSNRRAYAYLLIPEEGELTPIAKQRLAALKEFSDLGAGFKIAALDLELRGAGNLLGGQQHGHVEAVGFDLYCQMLERTVRELKGEEVAPEVATALNLGVHLRIPDSYIPQEQQRLRVYKRIAGVATPEESAAMERELADRYGPPPAAILHLLDYATLKAAAASLAIQKIERRRGEAQIKFHPGAVVDPQRLTAFVSRRAGAQFTPDGVLRVPVSEHSGPGVLMEVKAILESLRPPPARDKREGGGAAGLTAPPS